MATVEAPVSVRSKEFLIGILQKAVEGKLLNQIEIECAKQYISSGEIDDYALMRASGYNLRYAIPVGGA
jgi:hypothetical protein